MEITEKVAYLKGLMEGMKIDTESNEGKILTAMADILEDIGLELEDLWNAQGELEDGLDVVSDDLEDVEDTVYGDEDDESFDDEYYEDDADEDEDCYATTCPTCEETIYFRRIRPGGRSGHLPQLRRKAGVRPQFSGRRA